MDDEEVFIFYHSLICIIIPTNFTQFSSPRGKENIESLIVPNEFLNFNLMSFDINLVILLCGSVSLRSRQSVVTFCPEYYVKFLGYDKMVFI